MSRRILRGFRPEIMADRRIAQGLSRGELARQAGVSTGAVAKWETGRSTPAVDTLARVATVLGVSMQDLIVVPAHERYLGDFRSLAGLTQPQLAARIGFSSSTVADLERGHAILTDVQEERIAGAVGASRAEVRAAYDRVRNRPPGARP
ncbi:helix-turn-helix domain-containing protein [Williamsia herbipolensis]|uniref:helix-turn-helix domain-containing protein n=1 Tax=Williamsia herbipolensis TaxID=1603258 RepID=UPI0006979396|nr:helix-turn-helix transcriptional regulator [Williamsia herbipolensis]